MKKKIKKRGFTLIELVVVMALGSLVTLTAWKLFRMQERWGRVAYNELEVQRASRLILERIKMDIREAVWSDMLLGGKFIIQEPYINSMGNEFGGTRIKFAKFAGFDENGTPKIEKIIYKWDQKTGAVIRGFWDGPWQKDNPSNVNNPHTIDFLTLRKDGSGKGYLFFKEITYDQDEQFGLVGRTLILVGLKVVRTDHGKENVVELHTVIGPRYINSRDKEPFWNQNSSSVVDYKLFEQ
jgi:prepilin-type N-terminal cleavage/methylation domain-containing protein